MRTQIVIAALGVVAASTRTEQIHANHAITGGYVSDYLAELFERVLPHFGHDETMGVAINKQRNTSQKSLPVKAPYPIASAEDRSALVRTQP